MQIQSQNRSNRIIRDEMLVQENDDQNYSVFKKTKDSAKYELIDRLIAWRPHQIDK